MQSFNQINNRDTTLVSEEMLLKREFFKQKLPTYEELLEPLYQEFKAKRLAEVSEHAAVTEP